jgi:hypothetical protein
MFLQIEYRWYSPIRICNQDGKTVFVAKSWVFVINKKGEVFSPSPKMKA